MIFWLTGLPGSGKTTLAYGVARKLSPSNKVIVLDGDELRKSLCSDLGYSPEDRERSVGRIANLAVSLAASGYVVLVSVIAPSRISRHAAKLLASISPTEKIETPAIPWYEVYVCTPIGVCENRDVKGHYLLARLGSLPNFTGISAPYDQPLEPDFKVDASNSDPRHAIDDLQAFVDSRLKNQS